MYFVVSWDISASNPVWSQIDERLRKCFDDDYNWVRPVNTFYMVKISTAQQYQTILANLQAVAKDSPVNVNFIMSPPLTVTNWDGWLPQDTWTKVREIVG